MEKEPIELKCLVSKNPNKPTYRIVDQDGREFKFTDPMSPRAAGEDRRWAVLAESPEVEWPYSWLHPEPPRFRLTLSIPMEFDENLSP